MNEALMVSLLEGYAETRDVQVRDQLFDAFFPLAKSIAQRFAGRGADLEDLQQVAGIALLKALERFEPERGYRFVTYAVPTITGDVRNYLRDKGNSIRLSRNVRQMLYRMQKERERFSQELIREPTAKELSQRMGISPDEFLLLLQAREQGETVSLDEKTDEETDSLSTFLGEKDEGYQRMEDSAWMDWIFSKVNDVEGELLRLRYQQQLGQRETAAKLGVSQMQVSRLERRMLARLRAMELGRV